PSAVTRSDCHRLAKATRPPPGAALLGTARWWRGSIVAPTHLAREGRMTVTSATMKDVEALIAVVALVTMAPPTIAEKANIKSALECGAAKYTPHDNDYSDH